MPFSKTVLRDSVILAQVALGKLGTGSTTVVAKDLTELSDLLASTNHVLQRNSHLRASLTISVKKPSLSRSGSTVAKTTSTPKNVRKTPAKSKPAKDKAQKNSVKDKVSEAIIPVSSQTGNPSLPCYMIAYFCATDRLNAPGFPHD